MKHLFLYYRLYRQMRAQIDENWEGFESFQQEIKLNYAPLQSIKLVQAENSVQIQHIEAKPSLRTNKHKYTRKRKHSQFQVLKTKKQVVEKLKTQNKSSTPTIEPRPIIRQLKNLPTFIKSKSVQQQLNQKIPIFRSNQEAQRGQLIYLAMQPKHSSEYFRKAGQQDSRQINSGDIIFHSLFEGGNLESVQKVGSVYHLNISVDTNTAGHKQWFYFKVISPINKKATFCLHSFNKKYSLFQTGQKPYGKIAGQTYGQWQPIGSNLSYKIQQNKTFLRALKNIQKQTPTTYCLTFDLNLQANKELSIASCIPYTYSHLLSSLSLIRLSSSSLCYQQSVLCKSLIGLNVPLIRINDRPELKESNFIFINARTHPGESSSSWVIQGILRQLKSSLHIQELIKKNNIVLKIVPMLNAQGVYMGNYRTGILGQDINRNFKGQISECFPQIISLKEEVRQAKKRGDVVLLLDIHGHSVSPGCFIYGPDPLVLHHSPFHSLLKELNASIYFSRNNCKLITPHQNRSTLRAYFQNEENILSLTCQNSLGLFHPTKNQTSFAQFSSQDWISFGSSLLNSIIKCFSSQMQKKRASEEETKMYMDPFAHGKKYKTDAGDLAKNIQMLMIMQKEAVVLPRPSLSKFTCDEEQSINDSDSQSQDLAPQKQQQLMSIAKNILKNRQRHNTNYIRDYEPRARKSYSNGHFINNFKQYQFGKEDNTITEWKIYQRILSIPRCLKTQNAHQSHQMYSRRKAGHISMIMENSKHDQRVKTQEKDYSYNDSKFRREARKSQEHLILSQPQEKCIFYRKKRY